MRESERLLILPHDFLCHFSLYSSPPKSPPPFSKAESRFEREQRIKVGSLDSFTPGGTLERVKSVSPPPGVSAVQQRADRDRFRVEPGRIENYTIGKGSLAQQESYKVSQGLLVSSAVNQMVGIVFSK